MSRIAVIVPVHNEGIVVLDTISALFDAGVSKDDLYVVDDASSDNTVDLVKTTGVKLLCLEKNGGKAVAQRKLLKYFCLCDLYDYIVFLDGDTKVDKNFLNELKKASLANLHASLLVGQVKSTRAGYISALRSVEYALGHDIYKAGQSNFGLIFVAPGCVSMYKTSMLKKLSIEYDTLAEDMDLTMQVQRLGGEIIYVPRAVVFTQDPLTLKDYVKQVVRWQRGGWQVFKKHKVLSLSKKQGVDWLILFQTIDAFIFNRVTWLLGSMIILPWSLIWLSFVLDIAFSFAISCYVAIKNRRLDVVYKFPMYFWIGYINMVTYFKTFYEVIIAKQEVLTWNKVKRY